MSSTKIHNINFRLSPELHREICKEAGRRMAATGEHITLSDVVREIVTEALTK